MTATPPPPASSLRPRRVAIIGGTGLNAWPGITYADSPSAPGAMPYGEPSAQPLAGRLAGGEEVLFLPRHGLGHKLAPHRINYRANIHALVLAGVTHVIAVAAVGAISPGFAPGEVAVPDDLLDDTWGRAHTFFDGVEADLQHIEFAPPYAPEVRQALIDAAGTAGIRLVTAPVLAVTQGPRLETAAEVARLARDGAHMIGMTAMPEAALAAEAGLAYATLAVSVNWAAGVKGTGGIHDEIAASMAAGMDKVHRLVPPAVRRLLSGS